MRKLIYILIFVKSFSFSQSVLETESNWLNLNEENLSYYSIFNFTNKNDSIKNQYKIAPDLFTAYQNEEFNYLTGLKFKGSNNFSPKLKASYFLTTGITNTQNTPYIGDLQAKSFFIHKLSPTTNLINDLRGRIQYKTNNSILLQAGIDKQFIGEGDRSLLFGNQGVSSPFFLMKAKFWKFDYLTVHQIWREGNVNNYLPKASSTHYLNFNHGKTFSIGIFESVVHVIKDTIYNRGFEIEYLNPLIFYRPQEYSVGSTDNVILGLNGFITWKKNRLYGQLVLDDINIQEIRNKSNWWANKYGIQAGYKTWFKLNNTNYFLRTEINLVSPYTYSAQNLSASFSNQGLTNAHPLGANFIEFFSELAFNFKKIEIHSWVQFYMKGNDIENNPSSFGGDVFKSYSLRPFGDYGYYFGVGEKTYRLQMATKIEKNIEKYDWSIFIEPRLFLIKRTPKIETDFFITLGLHYNFGTSKRNY